MVIRSAIVVAAPPRGEVALGTPLAGALAVGTTGRTSSLFVFVCFKGRELLSSIFLHIVNL